MKTFVNTILSFAAVATLALADKAEIGKAAPDFTLKDASGKEVKLSDYKGKNVILEWVNYNCPFVKKHYSEGHMQKLQKNYADKGAVWIQISSANSEHKDFYDAKALESKATEQKSSATHSLVDAEGSVGKTYDAKTTPHMFIVNTEGVLAYAGAIDSKKSTNPADIEKSDNYVSAALDSLFAGEKVSKPETTAYGWR